LELLDQRVLDLQAVSQKREKLLQKMASHQTRVQGSEEIEEKSEELKDTIDQMKSLLSRESDVLFSLQDLRNQGGAASRYIAQQGDEIDNMVSDLISQITNSNESIIPSNFMRLSEGVYQFGTRKIHATILAGSLVVRVGGGYMKFVEFVKKYGKFESIKIIKAQGAASKTKTVVRSQGKLSLF